MTILSLKEDYTNSYTRILRRPHDQQESREGASQRRFSSQRYLMMFNGYCYKCNNYGHRSIDCKDHEKITPRRNQGGFFVQCYNCYHYGHFAKHWWMQGPLQFWRRKQVQLNDMKNHHPTKVWRIKLVYQNRNDEKLGKNPMPFWRLSISDMKCYTKNV